MRHLTQAIFALALFALCLGSMVAQGTSVTSYHNDAASTGVNSTETILVPSLTSTTFGKKFACGVDGSIYAQPLYLPNVSVTGGPYPGAHNIVFAATQHDSLYAFDADSGVTIWKDSFTTTALGLPGNTSITSMPASDTGSTDTSPEIGICGTPVIDPATNIMYVAAKTKQIVGTATHYVYNIYKIDVTNGSTITANANIVGSTLVADTIAAINTSVTPNTYSYTYRTDPVATNPQDPFVLGTGDGFTSVNGQARVYFNAMRQMNRPGLMILNGVLYVAFGSHGDNGPYHGWLIGFDKNTLAITGVLNLTPNGGLGGIWGGGAVPVVDPQGYIYVMTGNGSFDGFANGGVAGGLDSLGFPVNGDYGDCFVKIATDSTTSVGNQNKNGWGLRVADYFAPADNQKLSQNDTDLGSGGCVVLPDSAGNATHPHLLAGSGKEGTIFLLDRDSMGKFAATGNNYVQAQTVLGECFSTPAFYNGVLYYFTVTEPGMGFAISNAAMSTTPLVTKDAFQWPGATPSISASGTTGNNAVLWGVERTLGQLRGYALDSVTGAMTEIYTSAQAANSRDSIAGVSKFAAPAVADGHVFVGTPYAMNVFGMLNTVATAPPAAPSALSATSVSSLQISLSWTDNSTIEAGFAIEQSTDGVNFTQIATVGLNVTSYQVVTGLAAGNTYYYRVRAYNSYNTLSYSAYSNTASATTTTVAPVINYPSGFTGSTGPLVYNGTAKIVSNTASLTQGLSNQDGSVFTATTYDITRFSTTFTFQEMYSVSDGFTFCIQNGSPTALGAQGGGLGFAGLPNSFCVKFDLANNAGEGTDSTGIFSAGASPYVPATDLTASGIKLTGGDITTCSLTYDGTTLTEKITDTVTGANQTISYTCNIPGLIGSNTAYIGFTGATGGQAANQQIRSWSFSSLPSSAPAAPTNLAVTPTSATSVNLTWTDNSTNESGFLVLRQANGTGAFVQVGVTGAGVATYTDSNLSSGATYTYEVEATNSVGTSAMAGPVTVVLPTPPITPTGATPTAITTNSIAFTWNDNATNETAYNIFRKQTTASNFVQIASLPANSTSYLDTGLQPGTSYDYHIQAYNISGYSDFSGFTAVTLSNATPPTISLSASGPIAVNGLVTGGITFTANTATAAALPINYAISGLGTPGTDYSTLSGTVTMPANATTVTVPVTALANATPNDTVTAAITTTTGYVAGTPASATVVLEPSVYNATAGTQYSTKSVSGATGSTITLTFPGLPGSPNGAVYIWYQNGTAITTNTTGTYTIASAQTSQTGTYSVYAWAPGGVTGSISWNVTITAPPATIVTSVPTLSVKDGSSATFTLGLSTPPTANTTVYLSIAGTPYMTVSPATITLTPTAYTGQVVTVTAAGINPNDANRAATVTMTIPGGDTETVACTDVVSDTQTAANLTGTAYPLTGSNFGTGTGDSSVHASGNFWVDGSGGSSGTGISGTSDSFHFESQNVTGNFQMIVQLQNVVDNGGTTPRAGLMIRNDSTTTGAYLALAGTDAPSGGYALDSRLTAGTAAAESITSGTGMTYTYPTAWMMLSRVGNVLHAYSSSDGQTFTEVTPVGGVTWSNMSTSLPIGLFVSSGSAVNVRAVMSNFSITTSTSPAAPGFADADIGLPTPAGNASVNGTLYTLQGGGADITNASDQLNYMSETLSGDGSMILHVDSQTATNNWAKSGIMFRNSLAPGSTYVAIMCTPNNNAAFQYRDSDNGTTTAVDLGNALAPRWLKLTRAGKVFTAYCSTSTSTTAPTTWTTVGTHTVTYTPPATFFAGMADCSHNTTTLCTSVFSNVTVTGSTPIATPVPAAPPTPILGNYFDADIGTLNLAGATTVGATTFTETAAGDDIWNAGDNMHYYYQLNTADKTLIVHVDSEQNTNVWAKGGVMFRNSAASNAANVGLYQNPTKQIEMQWRDTDGAATAGTSQYGDTVNPKWLKLVKAGNVFTAYYSTATSPQAGDWLYLGTHTTVFTNASYLGGLALCAHSPAVLNTTVFSGFSQ